MASIQIQDYMKPPIDQDILQRVERVEAPADLFDRIEARIQAIRRDKVSMAWTLAASIAFALMVTVNVYLITSDSGNSNSGSDGIEVVANEMDMIRSNQLYHD